MARPDRNMPKRRRDGGRKPVTAGRGSVWQSRRKPGQNVNPAASEALTPVPTRGELMEQAFKPTALVVENDELQRSLITVLLEESEMNVIACESAEAAVSVLDQSGEGISMVF